LSFLNLLVKNHLGIPKFSLANLLVFGLGHLSPIITFYYYPACHSGGFLLTEGRLLLLKMKTYSILAATLAQINARQSFEAIQNFVPYQELSVDTNQQPVIGILSQQLPPELLSDPRFEGTDSYIMSTYVKYLEESGARVVPLIMGEPAEVTMEKLSKLNGILLPGGDGDYIDWGRPIFDKVKKYNDEGQFYPMWGTCLGFESLAIWASDEGRDVLGLLSAHRISLPIYYTKDPEDTKMFGDLGYEAETFTKSSMLLNSHDYGLSPDKFDTDSGLSSMFTLTSVSYEPEGDHRPFTASMESE